MNITRIGHYHGDVATHTVRILTASLFKDASDGVRGTKGAEEWKKVSFISRNTINVGTMPPPRPNNGSIECIPNGERCIGMFSGPQTMTTMVLYS